MHRCKKALCSPQHICAEQQQQQINYFEILDSAIITGSSVAEPKAQGRRCYAAEKGYYSKPTNST